MSNQTKNITKENFINEAVNKKLLKIRLTRIRNITEHSERGLQPILTINISNLLSLPNTDEDLTVSTPLGWSGQIF